jgi:O-6-methylguanine DNA methyltransferase
MSGAAQSIAPSEIAWCRFELPIGSVTLAASSRGLCWCSRERPAARGFRAEPAELVAWRARYAPGERLVLRPAALAAARAQLEQYARGKRRAFELELDLRGTPFQRRVWSELERIPYGQTITYGELARRAGHAGAARAVGSANGANALWIVVPCHRVVASNGLGGYGGGLDVKQALLELEGALPLAPR